MNRASNKAKQAHAFLAQKTKGASAITINRYLRPPRKKEEEKTRSTIEVRVTTFISAKTVL